MITVYIKKIENILENEKQNIINSLSLPARTRINKKRNEKIFLASICALSLLTDKQRADLDYTESGIPFFKTLNQDVSISHSDTFSAIAISDSKEVKIGIDVEDISKSCLSPRFLTENEKRTLSSEESFLEIWTKKEALFKFLKNDSLQFIHLDSTTPEKYDTTFLITKIENSILTICTNKDSEIEILQK